MENQSAELDRLRAEKARLKVLFAEYGIPFEESETQRNTTQSRQNAQITKPNHTLSLEQKVELFRSLFRGRDDVFARRWHSLASGKSGYQPVCLREWNRELSDKKKYKCAECPNCEFKQLGYEYIGNTLMYGQTELLLIFGKVAGEGDLRDYVDMKVSEIGMVRDVCN